MIIRFRRGVGDLQLDAPRRRVEDRRCLLLLAAVLNLRSGIRVRTVLPGLHALIVALLQ